MLKEIGLVAGVCAVALILGVGVVSAGEPLGSKSGNGYGPHGPAPDVNINLGVSGVRALAVGPNAVTNGGFESNGGAGTSVLNGWSVTTDNCQGDGGWYAQTGTESPLNGIPVNAPPVGSFAAMSDQGGPGTRALYQDITVPTGGAGIKFWLFVGTAVDAWLSPASLFACDSVDNEQFRADIITTASDPLTEIGGGVLMTLYQTMPGDPLRDRTYYAQGADLSALEGQTVRLRFVEADNQGNLLAGVDDVVLATGVPDLGIWGIGILGLLLAAVGASSLIQRRTARRTA